MPAGVSMRRATILTALAIGLAGFVAAGVAASFVFGSSGSAPASAEAFLFEIPDQLPVRPGQYVHTRTEMWERHGPKAAVIAAAGQRPEGTVAESWFEIGEDSAGGPVIVRALSTLSDSSGAVIQRATVGEQGSRTIDPRTGQVLAENAARTTWNLDGSRRRAALLKEALQSGAVLEPTAESLTIEVWDEPLAQGASDDAGDWSIPYVGDLDPTALVRRLTVDRMGTVTKDEIFIVDGAGSRVLVSQSVTVTEILSEEPDGVFEGR